MEWSVEIIPFVAQRTASPQILRKEPIMGEIADAMINGFLCQYCGVFLDGEEPGYPRSCEDCED